MKFDFNIHWIVSICWKMTQSDRHLGGDGHFAHYYLTNIILLI